MTIHRLIIGARRGVLGIAIAAAAAGAQGVRISGTTSMQFIELRTLVRDSAKVSALPGTGDWRTTSSGVPALCATDAIWCTFERSGPMVNAAPILQDLSLSGWGWMEGLSFRADVRGRTQLGSDGFTYPRANDHFNVLDAFAELERGAWRGRLGRQWTTGGLGVYNYDGANAVYRYEGLTVEGWAGRALLAGLNEPYTTSLLNTVETITPQQDGYIAGARARYRPDPLTSASLLYQRVLLADHSGLYSERVAFDGAMRRYGAQWDMGLVYDFATNDWNEARLRVGTAGLGPVGASLEYRRSHPFFELWTIWGAFSPVGFDEGRATVDWRPKGSALGVSLRGAYRRHDDPQAGFELRTNGWRAGGDLMWTPSDEFAATGSYDVDIGSGASSEDFRLGARWTRPSGLSLGGELSATQNIYEFRVGTGRIYGALASASVPVNADLRISADAGIYQHALTNGAAGPDWTQKRASVRLEWTLGRDPGAGRAP
jgi:hypothetical protein